MRTEVYTQDCGAGDGTLTVKIDRNGKAISATYVDRYGQTVATSKLEAQDWLDDARRNGRLVETQSQ